MKKALTLLTVLALVISMNASDVKLIVQRVDNGGLVAGNTYRVYAQMPSQEHSLHIVYGDLENPMVIESTAPFYQHQFASYSAANISNGALEAAPQMRFDSWITLGYENNEGNDMWDIGVDFNEFDNGGTILSNNGGWFLVPTDSKTMGNSKGLVLIGQFTSTGTITGKMNLQGWSAPQVAWRTIGATFSTTDAKVFGCNDPEASNYNASSTFNDGTCTYNTLQPGSAPSAVIKKAEESNWEVFPNPLRSNLINIQFSQAIDLKNSATRIDIIDMNGKLVLSHAISADAVLAGNRVSFGHSLAAGTYKAMLVQGDHQESKTLIVEK